MTPSIALQLYTVRDSLAKDFEGGVRRVAAMGFRGVEPAGYPGTTPEAAGRIFRELGLDVPSAHTGLPVGPDKEKVLSAMRAVGCRRIVSGLGPDNFKTADAIKASADRFNAAAAAARENGMAFGIHNHWWEFLPVDGEPAYRILLRHLDPSVFFELDVYWIRTAAVDPAGVVAELGSRAPLIHAKDGPCMQKQPMTALGEGMVDFAAIAKAGAATVEWMIVELDACATDMWEAVRKSHAYLTSRRLAVGRT